MVSRESATRNLCHNKPYLTIRIDENHSDMVKFGIGDHHIGILASKLESICTIPETTFQMAPQPILEEAAMTEWIMPNSTEVKEKVHIINRGPEKADVQPEWCLPGFWDDNNIL